LTSNQFFVKRIDPNAGSIFLEGDEHHHLARVARIKAGDEVWIFDEVGSRFLAEVAAVMRDRTRLMIIRRGEAAAPRPAVVLGQAVIKPKNMDLIVQKAAELGVSAIFPLFSARALPGRVNGSGTKVDRWRKIALEAAKQSRRSTVPAIEKALELSAFIRQESSGRKLYLSENGGTKLGEVLTRELDGRPLPGSVTVVTGPEGGWAPEEEKDLAENGFDPISLGRTVLRAETAAIAAMAMIVHFWAE
jgi:16S rRNA (uracil1498-N3)-methyltransferase